jgi:hypothetical protein
MSPRTWSGLTPVGYRLVLLITALSVAHHVDHILRGVMGWPLEGGFNLFSASLLVYPLIAAGVFLSRQHLVGPLFWVVLAGGGAVFILVVHVGPAAGDAVEDIPGEYASPVAGVAALAILAAFFAVLIAHCLYELRRLALARSERERA